MITLIDEIKYLPVLRKRDELLNKNEMINHAVKALVEDIGERLGAVESDGQEISVTISGSASTADETKFQIGISGVESEETERLINEALGRD